MSVDDGLEPRAGRRPRTGWRRLAAGTLACALAACSQHEAAAPEPLTVLAAASLTDALEDIGADFTAETGIVVRFSFASSSTLARQVEAGAPAAIFASAGDDWMDQLAERRLVLDDTRVAPIGNALVLVAPSDSSVTTVDIGPELDIPALLGPDGRIALGDPAHVPAGQYAEQAFRALGLWDEVSSRFAATLDVRGALALVERGETPLGVVYATDAKISEGVKVVGMFPPATHEPIVYPFAILVGGDTADARQFLAYVTGEDGLAAFDRYGFARR